MNFTAQILVGLFIGIFTGIFLGEYSAIFQTVERGFILLLQMTVLPYIICSLVSSLGSLTPSKALLLAKKAGMILVVLWVITLGTILIFPFSFPNWQNASFFSTSLVTKTPPYDFISMYIPSNPFASMANSVVPAVVLFSIALGLALMRTPDKGKLIDVLHVLQKALSKVSNFVVKLTPIGIFAIAAHTTGTIDLADVQKLQLYIILYIAASFLLSFWLIPGLISTMTPISFIHVLNKTKSMLFTAFMTGNLLVILPMLSKAIDETIREHYKGKGNITDNVDIIVSASFNFPNAGKLFLLTFVIFAGWSSGNPIDPQSYLALSSLGLFTFFGSANSAIIFLFEFFHIPIDLFQLYVSLGVIQGRFATLLASIHILTLGILGSASMLGILTFNKKKILRYLIISIVLTSITFGGLRIFFAHTFTNEYTKDEILNKMEYQSNHVEMLIDTLPTFTPDTSSLGLLERVVKRGELRVGFLERSLPYVYYNKSGQLVGLDVDMARILATELEVTLRFIPIDRDSMVEKLNNGYCDIIMSGTPPVYDKTTNVTFTDDYLKETLAILVEDHRRTDFLNTKIALKDRNLKIGVGNIPYFIKRFRDDYPHIDVTVFEDLTKFFSDPDRSQYDGIFITAERGSAWSLLHPNYTVVVSDDHKEIPLSYILPKGSYDMVVYVNNWIRIRTLDKTIDELYKYWVMGEGAVDPEPKWSIIRNVLHWVE